LIKSIIDGILDDDALEDPTQLAYIGSVLILTWFGRINGVVGLIFGWIKTIKDELLLVGGVVLVSEWNGMFLFFWRIIIYLCFNFFLL
jgi:hypothetical protein